MRRSFVAVLVAIAVVGGLVSLSSSEAIALDPPPSISGVSFSGGPSNPTLTVTGSGFGTQAALGTPQTTCGPPTSGFNYGSNLYVFDHTGFWSAGQGPPAACNFVGLVVTSYSDTQIVFKYDSLYPAYGYLNSGDSVTVNVLGAATTVSVLYQQPNDNYAAAQVISGGSGSVSGSNLNATSEVGEPVYDGYANSVWYRYAPAVSGSLHVDTCGSGIQNGFAMYTGSAVDALALWDGALVGCDGMNTTVVAGITYTIGIAGFGGETGSITLNWSLVPANDDFAAAQEISGASGSVSGSNVNATSEMGEQVLFGEDLSSVWYRYVPAVNGGLRIDGCGTGFDHLVVVYTGSVLDVLSPTTATYACYEATLSVAAGVPYSIRVSGFNGAVGDITLNWSLDLVAPVVSVVTPPDGAVYAQGDVVSADFECVDPGLVSCVGDVADGLPIDTATVGEHTFTVSSTDFGGNATVVTYDYSVSPVCGSACVVVGDSAVLEADSVTRTIVFPVTLSAPSTQQVTVPYAVVDGTATADVDHKLKSGTLVFKPAAGTGLTSISKSISVTVFGDATDESDETVKIVLGSPTGGYGIGPGTGTGTCGLTAGCATGTILDDDDAPTGLELGVGDRSVFSARSGKQTHKLPVTLSGKAPTTVTVDYVVLPGTATWSQLASGGGDYGGKTSGTLTFSPGQTLKQISLPIYADATAEADQSYTIVLSNVNGNGTGITIIRPIGSGTILRLA